MEHIGRPTTTDKAGVSETTDKAGVRERWRDMEHIGRHAGDQCSRKEKILTFNIPNHGEVVGGHSQFPAGDKPPCGRDPFHAAGDVPSCLPHL